MSGVNLTVLLVSKGSPEFQAIQRTLENAGHNVIFTEAYKKDHGAGAYDVVVAEFKLGDEANFHYCKSLGQNYPLVLIHNHTDQFFLKNLEGSYSCLLDKSEARLRVVKAVEKAFDRFKYDQELSKGLMAA